MVVSHWQFCSVICDRHFSTAQHQLLWLHKIDFMTNSTLNKIGPKTNRLWTFPRLINFAIILHAIDVMECLHFHHFSRMYSGELVLTSVIFPAWQFWGKGGITHLAIFLVLECR